MREFVFNNYWSGDEQAPAVHNDEDDLSGDADEDPEHVEMLEKELLAFVGENVNEEAQHEEKGEESARPTDKSQATQEERENTSLVHG